MTNAHKTLDQVVLDLGTAEATRYLSEYFQLRANGSPVFTGSLFDTFAGGADTSPDRITADDFVEVSSLSVHVPGRAALTLLEDEADEVNELLKQIDPSLKMEALDDAQIEHLHSTTGPAQQLWDLLRRTGKKRWG